MRDKYTAGALSGFLAGLGCLSFEFIVSSVLHLGRFSTKEFAGMVILLHAPRTPAENALAILVHLVFCSIMGGVFACLLELVSRRHDLFKGVQFGLGISGAIWAMTFLFGLRPENISTAINAYIDFASAAAYGLGLALLYRFFRRNSI